MKIEVVEICIPDCQRGDILKADDDRLKEGYHPIVFFDHDNRDFIGCMLTHEEREENEPMLETHFLDTSDEFKFENTQIVRRKFIKLFRWKPFRKVGRLSESGITFVENLIGDLPPETFARYYHWLKLQEQRKRH